MYNVWPTPSPFASWANGINTVSHGIALGQYYFTRGRFSAAGIYFTPGQKDQYCMSGNCQGGLGAITQDLRALGGDPDDVRFPAGCKVGGG